MGAAVGLCFFHNSMTVIFLFAISTRHFRHVGSTSARIPEKNRLQALEQLGVNSYGSVDQVKAAINRAKNWDISGKEGQHKRALYYTALGFRSTKVSATEINERVAELKRDLLRREASQTPKEVERNKALVELYNKLAERLLEFLFQQEKDESIRANEAGTCSENCHPMFGLCEGQFCRCLFEHHVDGQWCDKDQNPASNLVRRHKIPQIFRDTSVNFREFLKLPATPTLKKSQVVDAYKDIGDDHIFDIDKFREIYIVFRVVLDFLTKNKLHPILDATVCETHCDRDHGRCEEKYCVCKEKQYWDGQWCNVATELQLLFEAVKECQDNCDEHHGTCNMKGECDCLRPDFFQGPWCNEKTDRECSSNNDCLNGGKCLPSHTNKRSCVCNPTYGGDLCEISFFCFNQRGDDLCQNKAHCETIKSNDRKFTVNKCKCRYGYTGKFCETQDNAAESLSEIKTKCQKRKSGKKTGKWESTDDFCSCRPGWIGVDCKTSCPKHFFGQGCINNCIGKHFCFKSEVCNHVSGDCKRKRGVPRCYPGWWGPKCNIPNLVFVYAKFRLKAKNATAIQVLSTKDFSKEGDAANNFIVQSLIRKNLKNPIIRLRRNVMNFKNASIRRIPRQDSSKSGNNFDKVDKLKGAKLVKTGLASGFRLENVTVSGTADGIEIGSRIDYPADFSDKRDIQSFVEDALLENADAYKSNLGDGFAVDKRSIAISKAKLLQGSVPEPDESTSNSWPTSLILVVFVLSSAVVVSMVAVGFLVKTCKVNRNKRGDKAEWKSKLPASQLGQQAYFHQYQPPKLL